MADNPFEEEGELTDGLHCWSVEGFTVRRIEMSRNATLMDGDAYIVLDASDRMLYYWIGARCPSDKAGAAAVLAVQLHDELEDDEGDATELHCQIFREVQGEESAGFLRCFSSVRHAACGTPSCWRRRGDGNARPRLLRISPGPGCLGNVQALPPSQHYLDGSAAFVLDIPGDTSFHASGGYVDGDYEPIQDRKPSVTDVTYAHPAEARPS